MDNATESWVRQTTSMSGMAWLSRMVQLDQPHMRRTMFFTGSLASKWTGAFHVEQDKCEETVIEDEDWPCRARTCCAQTERILAKMQKLEAEASHGAQKTDVWWLTEQPVVASLQDTSHVDLDGRDKLQDVKAKNKFQL